MTEPASPRSFGLRAQILFGLALVTLFAVLTTGYLALWASGVTLQTQRENTTLAIASAGALAVGAVIDREQPLDAPVNRDRLKNVLARFVDSTEITSMQVLGANRTVVAARPPRDFADADPPLVLSVLSGVPPVFYYRKRVDDGETELLGYAPVMLGSFPVAVVRVVLFAPSPVTTVLDRSAWLLVGLAVGNAILVLALGYFVLTQLVVRPLQIVEIATARVAAGDWEQRLSPSGPREVTALAAAFNQMTASLVLQREQLIRTEKLASVGQLAAGVAHEIGNPLAAVLGLVDILRIDLADPVKSTLSPSDRLDTVERVKAETQRIHRIIQDLLVYSRPAKDEAQATDPLQVLRSTETLLAPQTRFKGVKVVVGQGEGEPIVEPGKAERRDPLGNGVWPNVMVSPGRLSQVFVNLLLNAADAMGGQGTITVRAAREGNRLRINFADEGPGVSADIRAKIFDPFFSTKGPGQGTGLGLSISRSIVESYAGTLELAPGDGGANFVVTLPAA